LDGRTKDIWTKDCRSNTTIEKEKK